MPTERSLRGGHRWAEVPLSRARPGPGAWAPLGCPTVPANLLTQSSEAPSPSWRHLHGEQAPRGRVPRQTSGRLWNNSPRKRTLGCAWGREGLLLPLPHGPPLLQLWRGSGHGSRPQVASFYQEEVPGPQGQWLGPTVWALSKSSWSARQPSGAPPVPSPHGAEPRRSSGQAPRLASVFPWMGEGGKTDGREQDAQRLGSQPLTRCMDAVALPARARFFFWPISGVSITELYLPLQVGEHPSWPVAVGTVV